jgi:addiction module HigA family antidote
MAIKHNKKIPVHPGEVLQELLQELNVTQTSLANNIGVTQSYVSDIINGRRDMTATMAYKLGAALEVPAESWMNLQKNWELSKVNPQVAKGIKKMAA